MKTTYRLVAMLLALIMVLSCAPLSAFAADTASTLKYESELYTNEALAAYKQYETTWTDSKYVKAGVKYTVYFDKEDATAVRDTIFYVINWNGERLGTDTDVDIVTDLIKADASEESGNRLAVVVVDFGGNELAKSPNIENSLAELRAALSGTEKLTVWTDGEGSATTTVSVHKNHVYVLPAGYRLARDIPYFETDVHASLGTRNYVMKGWNSHIADKKTVYYAYHTGDSACTFDHTANAGVECIAGAPQEIGGNVVAYAAGHKAPTVSRVEDCRKKDGSPMDYMCRLDIIYPAGEGAVSAPLMVQAATQSPRMTNIGTSGRNMLVGMEFCGYAVAVYDYAYSPMARGDHYGYIDPYGTHGQNGAKTSRAAIRCLRYFAEEYGYNDNLIGVAGISKGTPTTAVLSTINNKYVEEASSFTYNVNGTNEKTNGVWYEGDLNADGSVTDNGIVQPYSTYEQGYDGSVTYVGERTGEISSEVSAVYCAAGDGINRVYKGGESIILGGTNPTTGEETQHVPMVLSCGFHDQYGCWDHWAGIQNRFTNYADYPFLAISMEDMGHDYPNGIDPMRDYDRYNAYMQFFHSILNPDKYTPQVAWITPVDGAEGVSVAESIQVQLIKPATSLDAFKAATTVKDAYGDELEGTWTTNEANTSGLYTFIPTNGYLGGTEYTVTVGTPVVATATSKSFTAEAAGFLRPVADTYISAADKDGVFGTEKTLYIDNQRTYLATFNTADFEDANRAELALPLTGKGGQTVSVYLLDGFVVDESATCYDNTPALTADKLIGKYDVSEGDNTLDLLGIVAAVSSEKFTVAISGSANYFELNFEEYDANANLKVYNAGTNPQPADAPAADSCYSPDYVWRTGGATGSIKVVKDPADSANKVASVTSNATWNRIRWYNSFVSNKLYLDSTDVGKTFDMSFDLRIKGASSTSELILSYELDAAGGTLTTYKATPTADTWTTVTKSFTVNDSVITKDGAATKRGLLSFTLSGTAGCTYYFDNVTVKEQAPTAVISREDTSSMTAYITTTYEEEKGIVADTYVSAAQPDIAFGNGNRLLLNGGDDENIIFITYPTRFVVGRSELQLTVPAEEGASVKTEILLLDNYFVDEDRLTYNTMPDLESAVSLGEYTLKGGMNTLSLDGVTETLEGAYFTLVLRATDSVEMVFLNNFEDYTLGYDVAVGDNNVTDSENTSYSYYYGHIADAPKYVARKGGSASGLGNVLDDGGNKAATVILSTSATYGGRVKFFNSVSDSVMTASDPLIGKTLRFTIRVKAANASAVNNACTAFASAMLSAGTYPIKDASGSQIKSETVYVTDDWQTLTVDYTVRAEDIKVDTTANSNPAWGYPMFTVDFANTGASNNFFIDDVTVVMLNSDGSVNRIDIASSEGAKKAGETIGVRARSAKDPIADTYVSETDKDGVFGFEETLYTDSKRTYLATFKAADFVGAGNTYLDLPLAGDGSQTLKVYLLDGFAVDESSTSYNNAPELTEDKLIGTYTAEGGCRVDLTSALASVSGEYFTVAVKGSAHYYELNFEDYTATTTVSEHDNNVADTVETDRSHMYGFAASADKLNPLATRRGGNMSTRQIKSVSGNMVFSATASTSSAGYLKFYNALNDSADDVLAGKTFKYSVRVMLDPKANEVASGSGKTPSIQAGILGSGENVFYDSVTSESTAMLANKWQTLEGEYTISGSDVGKKLTSQWAPLKRFSYPMFGILFANVSPAVNSKNFTYFVDDIVVSEEAPSAISSLDSTGETVSVITATDIVADTYVSKGNPDTCYGDETTLKLGDKGGDKKALVLSFMNSALDERNYVDLDLFNGGDALKGVSVYYVLDYCANESTLTWNTMPEYEKNLLGVYDITAGNNRIDLSALRDKLTGEYFTIVLRTENHTYFENFENYPEGTTIADGTGGADNNVADTADTTRSHYHAFHENVFDATKKVLLTRRNGILDGRKIVDDGTGNMAATASTSVGQTYDGSMKFYNSLNDELITKTSDIVGKTFRFTAKVKLDASNSNLDKTSVIDVTAGVMTSYNNLYRSDTDVVKYADIKDGWATLSVDYTVSADHIAEAVTNGGVTNYSYPIFGLYFGDDNTATGKNTYFIDDVSVVEIIDGEPVGDAEFSSREAGDDIRFVSALDGNVTILEATASGSSDGDVISIVDGGNTYALLKAEAGKLMFGDYALCDELGNDYVLGADSVKVVAIYDDINGTVRFAIGDYLGYYKDGEDVKVSFELPAIDGGIGDSASFGTSGITPQKLNKTTSEIIGFQTNDSENAVRFVAGVDAIYYNAAGFKLETASSTKTVGSVAVYSAVTADSEYIYATDYGYNLMSALAVNDVESGAVVRVTPFLRVGSNYIYGESVCYKITTADGLKVEEVDESEFGSECNADLASASVDGKPVVGFDPDVTDYNVPAADVNSFVVAVSAAEDGTNVEMTTEGNVTTVKVTAYDGKTTKTYTFTAYEKIASEVVNKDGTKAIVTYVFDDGDTTTAKIVTELSDTYPSLTGSFALITDRLATLSTIEGKEGDGLLEYEFDEDGNYVYTKIENTWNVWAKLFDRYGDSFEAVSHTHTHKYIGENDNGGAFEYRNTNGDSFTSEVFPIGNVRKEYYASNQILRELGQRGLTMVGAGLTAGGYMIDYTDSYKALPQTSGAFIGKRTTYTYPKDPASMVNVISDFTDDEYRFNVKSYMVQHYNTSSTAPTGTSASNYSKENCMNAGVGYWTDYIDKAVEMGGWAAFCFHNVRADDYTGTTGHFVYESQAEAVFKHTEDLSNSGDVWVANFTDACLYVFARATSEVGAYVDADGNVVVSLDDGEDDEIFTMPLTVKVALPEGKTSAKLGETDLTPFTEGGVTYVYVNIVPGNSLTVTVS